MTDGDLVSEEKLSLYLQEAVINRKVRARGKAQHSTPETGDDAVVGYSSVESTVSALCDLWQVQRSQNLNPYPHPRGVAVKGLLKQMAQYKAERKRAAFADRGANTIQDGHTDDQFQSVLATLWRQGLEKPEISLRTLFDITFSHSTLTRGEDTRHAELADIFTIELQNQGPTRCFPLIATIDASKTNKTGKPWYAACLRTKNVQSCPVGALSFYLLYRFTLGSEEFPDFDHRKKWYRRRVLKGYPWQLEKEISYDTQLQHVKAAYRAAGIVSTHWTHLQRKVGSQRAEEAGADEASIRRLGRWNNDQMTRVYLTNLPLEAMKAVAGYSTNNPHSYYVARAAVEPPPSLLRQVFPEIEKWEGRVLLGKDNFVQDIAASGFLNFLIQARLVILQDAALLSTTYPSHSLWRLPVFQSYEFGAFQRQVLAAEDSPQINLAEAVMQSFPIVAEQLQQQATMVQGIARASDSLARTHQDQLVGRFDDLSLQVSRLAEEARRRTIKVSMTEEEYVRFRQSTTLPPEAPRAQEATPPLEMSRSEQPPPPPSTLSTVITLATNAVPEYRMNRTIQTVRELWQEWSQGVEGGPAVVELERRFQARWRRDSSVRMHYLRRKYIVDEINRLVSEGKYATHNEAVTFLDNQRGQWSLKALNEALRQRRPLPGARR